MSFDVLTCPTEVDIPKMPEVSRSKSFSDRAVYEATVILIAGKSSATTMMSSSRFSNNLRKWNTFSGMLEKRGSSASCVTICRS